VFFEKLPFEKQEKNCSCVLQIVCVQLYYSKTSYFLVKFPALSFKIKIEMVRPPPPPPRSQKWNIFIEKRSVQERKYLKMYISDFLQILQKISKTRGILLRFKMAAGLKMAVKKWFFDYNSGNIKYFYVLSFAICKS
jgi:hypothetical protein